MKGPRPLKRHAPTILSVVAAVGVAATTIVAVKATPKALTIIRHDSREKHDGDPHAYTKVEAFKSAWKCYIPSAAIGLSTIACIFGANALNKRRQAALTSAYILLDNAYKEYKAKIKELFGEDSEKLIKDVAIKDKFDEEEAMFSGTEQLFYEEHYGRLFERSKEEVLRAEYKFNLKLISHGHASLNDFYKLLGLPKTKNGSVVGWYYDDAYSWIDFTHDLMTIDDGLECYAINASVPPTIGYF